MKKFLIKYWSLFAIGLPLLIIDQITKILVVKYMSVGESIKIINKFFYISSYRNDGAAWSILEGQMIFFYLITLIAIAVFVYFLKDYNLKKNTIYSIGLVLLIFGALGNFVDRIVRKEVVDFLDFIIFDYNFPTFNVADMCLVVGCIIFAFDILILSEVKKRGEKNSQS